MSKRVNMSKSKYLPPHEHEWIPAKHLFDYAAEQWKIGRIRWCKRCGTLCYPDKRRYIIPKCWDRLWAVSSWHFPAETPDIQTVTRA